MIELLVRAIVLILALFVGQAFFLRNVARKLAMIKEQGARRGGDMPALFPIRGLFGLGRLASSISATLRDWGPQYVRRAFEEEMGNHVNTVLVCIMDYILVMTRDPANVKAALAPTSNDFDVSEHRTASWAPLVGHGIFTSRGSEWKHSRALVRPQFAADQINDLELLERHVQQLFAALDRQPHEDISRQGWTKRLDLQPLFYNLTLDVMTEMLYGHSVHSQNPSERVDLPELPGHDAPDRENIGMHMDAGKAWIETRGALWKYRWLLPDWKFKRHCAAVHKYANYFVHLRLKLGDEYLDSLQQQGARSKRDRFVLLHELAKVTQDPEELRSQTLNVLTAGRDTTAALLGWMFYFLARHPHVYQKLRNEVLEQFGPYDPNSTANFEFRKVRDSLPYMQAVMNEVLRKAPVVPLNERVALKDTVLPRGGGPDESKPIFVPKGTQILIPTYAMANRADLWGDDVDAFRPERWLGENVVKPGFEFIPFGGGARQCLGRKHQSIGSLVGIKEADVKIEQLARIKASYVTIRMLQRYEFIENADEHPDAPPRFHHTIENRSGSGCKVSLYDPTWLPIWDGMGTLSRPRY
jgi:cytochrome P450